MKVQSRSARRLGLMQCDAHGLHGHGERMVRFAAEEWAGEVAQRTGLSPERVRSITACAPGTTRADVERVADAAATLPGTLWLTAHSRSDLFLEWARGADPSPGRGSL